jgi:hypothetical protein
MSERTQDVGRVVVAHTQVRLGADDLCRPRCVRYAVPVPEHVVTYRVGRSWGLPVTGTPVEGDAWEAAARTYLDEVSRALEELCRAHSGRSVRLDLFAEERRWRELHSRCPGRVGNGGGRGGRSRPSGSSSRP